MTAAVQERTRAFRGYQAGAVDFLNKPIDRDVLRGKVEVFAQLFAQKKQIQQRMEELHEVLLRFIQHGDTGCPVEVCVDGTQNERVCIRVKNQGVMPAHTMENVFKPYNSAGEKPGSRSGLGLGLYIVKEFVAAHKGSVSVESLPEYGTVFEVALPREVSLLPEATPGPPFRIGPPLHRPHIPRSC